MDLRHIKGIGPAKQEKLKSAGIYSVDSLARADIDAIAKKSGLAADQVREFKEKAVALSLLEDIKGMGPQTVKTLAESGIQSLKDLYEASAEYIAAQAKVAQDKAKIWQAEAKKLADHVATEAKTAEGRKKLRSEAVDVAVKAAKKTQETVVELFHRAQKDGEAAIAKAKELRDKAPQYVHDARVKAESALKDAEAKVKQLQAKAPEAAKDLRAKAEAAVKDAEGKVKDLQAALQREMEKVKAANEGLLTRVKARFGRN